MRGIYSSSIWTVQKLGNLSGKKKEKKKISFVSMIRYKNKKKNGVLLVFFSSFCEAKFVSERGSAEISRTFTHHTRTPDFIFDSYQKKSKPLQHLQSRLHLNLSNRQLGNHKEREAQISKAQRI